jgi:hypothetical protein
MARCPAHDDSEPSLSIANGDDGKVFVRCHAGCEQHRVIAELRACGIWSVEDQRGAADSQPRVVACDPGESHFWPIADAPISDNRGSFWG